MVLRSLMKRTSLALITTALLIALPAQSFAATRTSVSKPKSAGRTVAAIPNTILSGTTPPSSAIGINGDFYIDVKNANIYGPKSKGKWLTPISLRGIAGTNGSDGKNGSDAKNVITASSSAGPQGIQGEKGATGSIGATGSSGAAGAQGPAGASGSGTGPTGAKGDTGLTGSTGNTGAKGDTGLTGSTGPAGNKGETGTVGSNGTQGSAGAKGETGTVGPSNVRVGTFSFVSNLSGAAGSTKPSSNFGDFTGGKSYLIKIYVKTFNVSDTGVTYPITMSVNSAGSSAVLDSTFYIVTGTEYQNPGECMFTTLIAELTVDGTGILGSFNIQVVPMIGSSGLNISMSGKYFSLEVGQIG
jgi:Collagen triple helix repeat (20 copies)